jgi:small-conductance mechanosensitive channel
MSGRADRCRRDRHAVSWRGFPIEEAEAMRLIIALVAALAIAVGPARADTPAAAPQMGGWFEHVLNQFEAEAISDISMAPDMGWAIDREWRSLDRDGSAAWVLVDLGWVALATIVALLVERAVFHLVSRRLRRRMRLHEDGPSLYDLIGLLVCNLVGIAGFYVAFAAAGHYVLPELGVTALLTMLAANVLVRWRIVRVIADAILQPGEPIARLIEIPDDEARRLSRFLSLSVLAVIVLVAFGRYGLTDEDSGASHVVGLVVALLVCGLYLLIAVRARRAAEALIRGRRGEGVVAAIRDALARAWMGIALSLVAGLLVIFVAGLSLGLLSYYRAVTMTLGILFVLTVLERLTERAWRDVDMPERGQGYGLERMRARVVHRILRVSGLVVAVLLLAWVWIDTIEMSTAAAELAMHSATAAVGTLFIAFIIWELARLAIDRHLQDMSGPSMPGDDDENGAPASRLQTILPLMRAAFGVVIAVIAALIVLSRLGVDTAPLIAGAGVFGLAVSFGSQSLVRDIISGLFYMWDDAFRVGEYIDTGRLKGTVETLGIRSVKLRHQNGPLHTIPYGQLGAVSNLSRDFATIKFNLRLEPGTDVDLVRRTAKQIGVAMQENPEMAAEVMLPLKLQGIAEVVDNAVIFRFKFTARPIKPSWVQREYLKRIYQVFAEKRIAFASGALTLQTLPSLASPELLPALPAKAGAKDLTVVEGAAVAAASGAIELPAPMPAPSAVA